MLGDHRRHLNHILAAVGTVSLVRSSLNDLKEFKDHLCDKGLSLKTARTPVLTGRRTEHCGLPDRHQPLVPRGMAVDCPI